MSLGIDAIDAISKEKQKQIATAFENQNLKVPVTPRSDRQNHCHPKEQCQSPSSYHHQHNCEEKKTKPTIEDIFATIRALERNIFAEHRSEFDLRMAFERQDEKLSDLRTSLETEKMRNQRLVQLIRGVDSSSSATEDDEECARLRSHWPSRTSSTDAFESISPLLMQHRYDELSISYRQCRRQMAKKDKLLVLAKCEKEELQTCYDHLLNEFKIMQKRFEELCSKYLRLQTKKQQEVHKLREALNHASRCLLIADSHYECANDVLVGGDNDCNQFRQNFLLFVNALRECTSNTSLKI